MNTLKVLAAGALALAPALAGAEAVTTSNGGDQVVTPGGIAQTGVEALPVLGAIPTGAVVVGGVVVLGGVAIGVVAGVDGDTAVSTATSTN